MSTEKKIKPPKYHHEDHPHDGGMSTFIHKQPLLEAIGCAAVIGTAAAILWMGFKLKRYIHKQIVS